MASAGAAWPTAAPMVPSQTMGATAAAASTFAGSDTSDSRSKWKAIRGAVPTVAAAVTANASATGPGTRRSRRRSASGLAANAMATTAAKLSCQPGSPAARGLSNSVAAAASRSA